MRRNIDRARQCIEIDPTDVDLLMLLAANEHALGRYEDAVATYRRSLAIELRPEIYLDLGLELLALHRREEAVSMLVEAVRQNSTMMQSIDDVSVKEDVNIALMKPIDDRTNFLLNSSFLMPGPSGRRTTFIGVGDGGSAAAARWRVANSEGTTTTEIVPGTRPGSTGNMLHVVTSSGNSGVVQLWFPKDLGPERTRTSIWARVVRGKIVVATGNAEYTAPGSFSQRTGEWERLVSLNSTCPANRTVIYSVGGPAEFYVEEPSVTRVPGKC